jgi:predicted AAA+ superfamily ATPase
MAVMSRVVTRTIEPTLHELLQGFPIVTLTGPRQSGKTTLARSALPDKPYVSLEDPDERRMALEDPRGFLARHPDGAILDEVQRAPQLLSYVQTRVDADGRMGLYLLTGSQQLGLVSGVSQSLAGRSAFLELLPFSIAELKSGNLLSQDLNQTLFRGGYPPIHHRGVAPKHWHSAYVTAYLERDLRQLLRVADLEAFARFVRVCAGTSGRLLNYSSLAMDCGVSHHTAHAWMSILEASYIVFLLRPLHANFRKRLVKAPRLYFFDAGLLCWLLGIQEPSQLDSHPLRGQIFETFVVAELMKSRLNRGERASLWFWRDSNGHEVDVVADLGSKWRPIEIKSGQTLNADFFSGLHRWCRLAGDQAAPPVLVYGGRERLTHGGVEVYGWDSVDQLPL